MAAEHQCRREEENFSSEDCDESCFNQHLSWDLRMSWNFLVSKALPSDSLPNCNTVGWNLLWKKLTFRHFFSMIFTIIAKTNYFNKQNSTVFNSHFYLTSLSVHVLRPWCTLQASIMLVEIGYVVSTSTNFAQYNFFQVPKIILSGHPLYGFTCIQSQSLLMS